MPSRFPDPATAPADGPLAVGGDLEPETVLEAYRSGIFPWPSGGCLYWWSPDPRMVLPLDGLHVSRSLRRTLRSGRFTTTIDMACRDVIAACADRPGEGTWITPEMTAAYGVLHELGIAHSVEVWQDERLVGGLYGVALGAAFMGESMFHRVRDASKVALAHLDAVLVRGGYLLFDAQLPTDHLVRMGAVSTPRDQFLDALDVAVRRGPLPFR
jgi:leucyl/phenylalanyl-tRNA---protein transferase